MRTICLLTSCLFVAACEMPTEPPLVQQRWILPLDGITLEQDELLPDDVTIVGDLYNVAIDPVSRSQSLGDLCPECVSTRFPVPVPAYQGQVTSYALLPQDVLAAEVQSGSVDVTISNNLSFDPIAGGGSITITVTSASGGAVLGTLVLESPTDALPPSSSTVRTLTIGAGRLAGAIKTKVDVDSPGTQTATIDITDDISVRTNTTSLLLSEATIDVDGLSTSFIEDTLNTEDLEGALTDAIVSGAVVMNVANPFGLTFSGTLVIGSVVKNLTVPADSISTVSLIYTGDELRSFLGFPDITLLGEGTLGGRRATVSADLDFIINPSLDVVIELGG